MSIPLFRWLGKKRGVVFLQRLEQAVAQVVIEGPVLNFVFVAIGTAVGIGATAIDLRQPLLILARELVPRI